MAPLLDLPAGAVTDAGKGNTGAAKKDFRDTARLLPTTPKPAAAKGNDRSTENELTEPPSQKRGQRPGSHARGKGSAQEALQRQTQRSTSLRTSIPFFEKRKIRIFIITFTAKMTIRYTPQSTVKFVSLFRYFMFIIPFCL
jgi:hypothetical protein